MSNTIWTPPHHGGTNICCGDGYFANSIKRDYGETEFKEMMNKLRPEYDRFKNLGGTMLNDGAGTDYQESMDGHEIDQATGEILTKYVGMTLGQKLEAAFDMRFEIDELEGKVKDIKSIYTGLQREILAEMAEKDLDKIECPRGSASYKVEPYPNIQNHMEFFEWVAETKRFEFLEKRCSRAAIKDMLTNEGLLPPGIATYNKESISLRKKSVRRA